MFSAKLAIHYINGAVYDINDEHELEDLFSSPRLFEFIDGTFENNSVRVTFSANSGAYISLKDNNIGKRFHFDNGSGETEPVLLFRGMCPEKRMMCSDIDTVKDILLHFCETGTIYEKYNWI